MTRESVKLEEYKRLINDYLEALRAGRHISYLACILTGGILGALFSKEVKIPLLFLTPLFIIFPLWQISKNYRINVHSRLSAYLKVFIEEEIDGIEWTTASRIWDKEDAKAAIQKNKLLMGIKNFFRNLYAGLVLACLFSTLVFCFFQEPKELKDWLLTMGSVLFVLFLTWKMSKGAPPIQLWENGVKKWRRIKQEMRRDENQGQQL